MTTDVQQFIEDLDGGVFIDKLAHALSAVAGSVDDYAKKGTVTVTFDMAKIGNSAQVMVKHKLAYNQPTARGKSTEEELTETPMYVGPKGAMTLMPLNQSDMFAKNQPEKA